MYTYSRSLILTKRTIALDPGVRTFQTGFSTDEVTEFSSQTDKISKLHKKIDLLKSLRDKKEKKIKRKKILKLNNKIRNIVNDVHWKTITYLKTNYTDVLLPSFDSQEMVTCSHLHSTTKRRLLGLQHYKFKKRLQEKTELNACCKRILHVKNVWTLWRNKLWVMFVKTVQM
jgi:putative transposase